jgi:hypothetical protein
MKEDAKEKAVPPRKPLLVDVNEFFTGDCCRASHWEVSVADVRRMHANTNQRRPGVSTIV